MGIAKILGCLTKQPQRVILKTDCLPGINTYEKLVNVKPRLNEWAKTNHIKQLSIDNFQKESNEVEFDSATINEYFEKNIKVEIKDKHGKLFLIPLNPFEKQGNFVNKLFSKLYDYKNYKVGIKELKFEKQGNFINKLFSRSDKAVIKTFKL